ncbi:hypothetical protein NECAME_10483 [Necator americanus]|uniref:Uncharacterized protein n=1 Tax=Necator americanus TaxID=51031 RepID=W2TAU2_NECAM|nr:hypothetical protein NECAME_10483 [Necator americanus]ETN78286.1 hypothetical protein NECAME_10483 [Necator americanus]
MGTARVSPSEENVEEQNKTTTRPFPLKKIFFGVVLILVLLAVILVLIWLILLPGKEDDGKKCSRTCRTPKLLIPHPPLVIISLDGYSTQYLSRKLQPTFDRMAECGVTAKMSW